MKTCRFNTEEIKCIVFDFANTLYSGLYFNESPTECENWRELFDTHIFDKSGKNIIERKVMNGELETRDIAEIISRHVGLNTQRVIELMERGCENLAFNPMVFNFAVEQNKKGKTTAMVTVNMDIFTEIVVPAHGLKKIFDVIVNSFDYKDTRKENLWKIAFRKIGGDISFSNSLLIDDIKENVELFTELGGHAYQYQDDKHFHEWLCSNGFIYA